MTLKETFLSVPVERRGAEFLSVKEAAYLLGKHPSAIRRMIDEGKIQAIKVGGTFLVYKPSLLQLVQEYS